MNISLTKELVEIVDHEIKTKKYANRSEFFRDLIRRQYVLNNMAANIEELTLNDADYKLIQKIKKGAKLISISKIRS